MSRTATKKQTASPDAYEDDFYRWCMDQSAMIRAGRIEDVDLAHLAEEVEDMGGRDRREMTSRLVVLLMHLLKQAYQPRRRSRSWTATIVLQRSEIAGIFEQSPSLKAKARSELSKAYRTARQAAIAETGLSATAFPDICPWTVEQILDGSFLP